MAIRVLLDHGVNPAHIIFVTFLVAQSGGVAHLRRMFPDVNIVTGAVDDGLREVWLENAERHNVFPDEDGFDNERQHKAWVIEPGMGQIGLSPLQPPSSQADNEGFSLQVTGITLIKGHSISTRVCTTDISSAYRFQCAEAHWGVCLPELLCYEPKGKLLGSKSTRDSLLKTLGSES